jgi:hypothetical protein
MIELLDGVARCLTAQGMGVGVGEGPTLIILMRPRRQIKDGRLDRAPVWIRI